MREQDLAVDWAGGLLEGGASGPAVVPGKPTESVIMTALRHESSQRVRPGCPHFGLHPGACGGCKMQHLDAAAQVAVKQRVLEDNLQHLAKVQPEQLLRPIHGPTWGYRYRARLSVRHVAKKGTVLIGFHERKSRYVADMSVCPVLPPKVSAMLLPLRELLELPQTLA
jgi:23S rRNA (uracil1939-C5)-methyltransferase